jgi:hypothetical protein
MDAVIVNRDAPATILRNTVGGDGHWVRFRVLDRNGRDALGSILTATIGQRQFTRPVLTSYSYMAAHDPRVHLGLGASSSVDELSIRWIDGVTERFGPFPSGSTHVINRGAGDSD